MFHTINDAKRCAFWRLLCYLNESGLGHRAITPIRFGAFCGQTPEFWHGLQVECDFRALGKKQKQLTAKIRPAQSLGHAA